MLSFYTHRYFAFQEGKVLMRFLIGENANIVTNLEQCDLKRLQ